MDTVHPFKAFSDFSNKNNVDLLYINAPMRRGIESKVVKSISELSNKKDNVFLILVTEGGSADAAYKLAKILQRKYQKFSIIIPGWCKSAGTLLSIGADEIYFGELGELGPLDIQMGKKDELIGFVSGLDLQYGIESLKSDAYDMFESFMLQTCAKSGGRVTLKTSAEIATALTQTYIARVAEQISPGERGETARLMKIAIDYGRRLNSKFSNLKGDDALAELVSGYSSHGFVIDHEEAKTLFERVHLCTPELESILDHLGEEHWFPPDDGQAKVAFLNEFYNLLDSLPEDDKEIDDTGDSDENNGSENATKRDASTEVEDVITADEVKYDEVAPSGGPKSPKDPEPSRRTTPRKRNARAPEDQRHT